MLTNPRDKRGWPQTFPPGRALYRGLTAIYYWIEASDTGGGAFRRLYAAFLDEAGATLGDARLKAAAERYRELAAQWTALAEAALPDNVPLLRDAREAMAEQSRLFSTVGPAALPQLEALARRREALEAAAASDFPLSEGEAAGLRAELRQRVLALHDKEQAAAVELAKLGTV